jgi:hypothetical protein
LVAAALRCRPFAVACAAAAAVVAAALAAFTPRYETNDDVTMNLVAAGLLVTDRPDEHLLYSNTLVGLPLKALYDAFPRVPWYGLYHYAALAAAAAAACYALLRVDPGGRQAAVALFFLAVVVLPCLVGLQFTKTAFLASLAGLLLLAPLRGAAPWSKAGDTAGVALVVLGSLIRFQSFALALVVAAPVAAAGALPAPRRALRRAALPGLAAVLALALNAYNARYYARSPGWEDFYAYNALRAEFTDYNRYPLSPKLQPALDVVGWEPVDLDMMRLYFFADRQRYSLEKLRQFTAAAPSRSPIAPERVLDVLSREFRDYPDLLALLAAALCAPLLASDFWRRFALSAAVTATALVLMVALAAFYWFPAHVGYCLFGGALAAGALCPGDGTCARLGAGRSGVLRVTGPLLAAALVLWSVKEMWERHVVRSQEHEIMHTVMRLLRPGPDKIFVIWADMLKLEKVVYPFEDLRDLRDVRCVWLSSLLSTPFTDLKLRELGIGDIYRAMCERPDIYFLAHEGTVPMYQYYVRRRYGIHTKYEVVFPTLQDLSLLPGRMPPRSQFVVFRLSVGDPAAGDTVPRGET